VSNEKVRRIASVGEGTWTNNIVHPSNSAGARQTDQINA
jgi:hypothetical protein